MGEQSPEETQQEAALAANSFPTRRSLLASGLPTGTSGHPRPKRSALLPIIIVCCALVDGLFAIRDQALEDDFSKGIYIAFGCSQGHLAGIWAAFSRRPLLVRLALLALVLASLAVALVGQDLKNEKFRFIAGFYSLVVMGLLSCGRWCGFRIKSQAEMFDEPVARPQFRLFSLAIAVVMTSVLLGVGRATISSGYVIDLVLGLSIPTALFLSIWGGAIFIGPWSVLGMGKYWLRWSLFLTAELGSLAIILLLYLTLNNLNGLNVFLLQIAHTAFILLFLFAARWDGYRLRRMPTV
jgi:hypothetical protein